MDCATGTPNELPFYMFNINKEKLPTYTSHFTIISKNFDHLKKNSKIPSRMFTLLSLIHTYLPLGHNTHLCIWMFYLLSDLFLPLGHIHHLCIRKSHNVSKSL